MDLLTMHFDRTDDTPHVWVVYHSAMHNGLKAGTGDLIPDATYTCTNCGVALDTQDATVDLVVTKTGYAHLDPPCPIVRG